LYSEYNDNTWNEINVRKRLFVATVSTNYRILDDYDLWKKKKKLEKKER